LSTELQTYLSREGERVAAALDRSMEALPAAVAGPVRDAVRHGVTSGGKRLRPILCVTAYRACGGKASDDEALYDLAASLELIHAYSLMHDDLPCMDDADLRRGSPTTHRVHGEDATMVGGAALIPFAALRALQAALRLGCPDATARRVARTLVEAAGAGGMVGGQWLDLQGEGRSLRADELGVLHGMKTGALLTAGLTMGARAAGAEVAVDEALEEYGRAIGLAFQIADDILDATQSAEVLGKTPSDAELEKSTYVALHGLEGARTRAGEEVDAALVALRRSGLDAPILALLARYIVEREH